MRPTLRERVFSRLVIDPESGCLLWTGYKVPNGYGYVGRGGKYGGSEYVHRLMYEWFVGPIPEGFHVDHLCRVRHCAAPAHLEAVTPWVNYIRGCIARGDGSNFTHCLYGHEYTPENTYQHRGRRHCRECARRATREWKARRRARAAA